MSKYLMDEPLPAPVAAETPLVGSPPAFPQPSYSFTADENAVTGRIALVKASDPDTGDVIGYSLSGSGAHYFNVNQNGRIGVVANRPTDFEQQSVYNLTLTATDSAGNFGQTSVTITLNDLNDESPLFDAPAYNATVAENSSSGSLVTVHASDADAVDAGGLAYSLCGCGAGNFEIDESTGEITVASTAVLDREFQPVYHLTVTATDAAGNTGTTSVTIALGDVNDTAPAFAQSSYDFSLDENATTGRIGLIQAADADLGDAISYSLSGVGAEHFKVNQNGRIGIAASSPADFEDQPVYNLTLTATDLAGNSGTTAVTITLNDLNDEVPLFDEFFYIAGVFENSTAGSVVTVQAFDADAVDASGLTYSFCGCGGANFEIDATTGEITVSSAASLDREIQEFYFLTVIATDHAGNEGYADVAIVLIDENDNAPVLDQASYSYSIDEGITTGKVGQVYSTDADLFDVVSYQLSGSGAGHFKINQNGRIGVNPGAPSDFEAQSVYNLTLTATDFDGNSSQSIVTITLNDLNDELPVFDQASYSASVPHQANSGTLLTVLATDADAIDATGLVYTLNGSGADNFVIDSGSGEISVSGTAGIDYATTSSYSLTVTATDLAGHATDVTLGITVTPDVDAPSLSVTPAAGDEDMPIALSISSALVSPDIGETLSITIAGVPVGAVLSAGFDNGDGSWTLIAAELSGLTLTPPADFFGDIPLTVIAMAELAGTTASTSDNLLVSVAPESAGAPLADFAALLMPAETAAADAPALPAADFADLGLAGIAPMVDADLLLA
ncbi:MAG TPA: cadherin repeat domain-containing protein [Solimonas sp.]|nr:cadherin repeat domain-containing protein [Solimonas sp.]